MASNLVYQLANDPDSFSKGLAKSTRAMDSFGKKVEALSKLVVPIEKGISAVEKMDTKVSDALASVEDRFFSVTNRVHEFSGKLDSKLSPALERMAKYLPNQASWLKGLDGMIGAGNLKIIETLGSVESSFKSITGLANDHTSQIFSGLHSTFTEMHDIVTRKASKVEDVWNKIEGRQAGSGANSKEHSNHDSLEAKFEMENELHEQMLARREASEEKHQAYLDHIDRERLDKIDEFNEELVEKELEKNQVLSEQKESANDNELSMRSEALSALEILENSQSSRLQKAAKAAAIVNATIKTYEAANAARSAMSGVPIVGPALGIAAGAAAVAAGMSNINKIRGARERGGAVMGNSPYLVGERGPEIVVPNVTGSVISNNDLQGLGGDTVNVHISAVDAKGVQSLLLSNQDLIRGIMRA